MARKAPTVSTIKRLFATSGNICAFNNCNNSLVDEEGNVLGEVCHIEGASKNGPRYNEQSNDEYRRSYDNLILLCERHHKIVDNNTEKYSIEFLNNLKKVHQDKGIDERFDITENTANKVAQKVAEQYEQNNSIIGDGQQYNIQAETININTVQNEENESNIERKAVKNKIELIAGLLSIVSLLLTLLTQFTNILPKLSPYFTLLIIVSSVFFMILFGYIAWSKSESQKFKYSVKKRGYSKISFFTIPLLAFTVWFFLIKGSKEGVINEKSSSNISISTFLQQHPNKEDFISNLYEEKEILFNHLKNDNYEDILIIDATKLGSYTFDLIIYCHNSEMNQMGRPMLFINFYDINTNSVNWDRLNNDWQNVSNNVSWEEVKAGIESINGFKYALERSTPSGTEKPHLYFVQLVGKRNHLNQIDITTMQNNLWTQVDYSPFNRVIGTYDYMIEKFRPPLN